MNALLGVEISPVADYPTTAVPLLFDSGERSEATVIFSDGTTTSVAPTAESLRPSAAQQESSSSRDEDERIAVLVREAHEQSRKTYGSPRGTCQRE